MPKPSHIAQEPACIGAVLILADNEMSPGVEFLVTDRGGFKWWHATLILAAANAVSALPAGFGGDFAFYNAFRQPAVAPPDWAFAPVWLVLNVTSLLAMSRIANAPDRSASRLVFLWSEGMGWVLFSAFTTLYFLLHSPLLGAVDTVAGLIVGLVSLVCACRLDRLSAGFIALRVLWLLLATYVSVFVALSNPDPFFATGPLL
jgi:tryptophan-rich sensory protein